MTHGPDLDALAHEVARILRPLMASAAEKGRLLAAEVHARAGGPPPRQERGLAPAVRRAAEHVGPEKVRDAARALERRLRETHGMRDSIK